MRDPLQRLYKTKLALLATIFVVVGSIFLVLVNWPGALPQWLVNLPLNDLGSALFTTGLVVIAFEYVDGNDSEDRAEARLRATLRSEAPAIRDAVIRGFAVNTEDLKRVATPETLDQLAENSLGLRFGDKQFAREVYGDIRDQAIKSAERWYDARVEVDLKPSAAGDAATFDAVVRWEYRVVPRHRYRRFVVVSDRRRYDELASQSGEVSVWFKPGLLGLPATHPDAFSLVQFTVDGIERAVARDADGVSQTYRVDVGAEAVSAAKPVVIAFTYLTRVSRAGHVLRFDVDRPTRGLDVVLNYMGCGIERMRMFDYVSTGRMSRIPNEPSTASERSLRFGHDGWLFPRSGLLFVWTLQSEVDGQDERADDDTTPAVSARHSGRR